MSKIVLTDVSSGFQLSKINENFQKIEDELNNKVLYRNPPNGEPNTMEKDLDLNDKNIINVQSASIGNISATNLTLNGELIAPSDLAITALPPITDQEGKFLSNDGIAAFWKVDPTLDVISDLGSVNGDSLIGSDDGNSGSLWTTLKGFISYLKSSVGSSLIGFIQAGIGAVQRTTQNKLREVATSITDFGAVCNSVDDDSNAFLLAAASGKKRIYVPPGAVVSAGVLEFSALNGVVFFGDGVFSSRIKILGTTGDVFTFSGCQHSGFVDCGFFYAAEPTSGWVIKFTNGCFEPIAKVRLDYCFNGIWVEQASEANIEVVSRYGFGQFLSVKFGGTASKYCYGGNVLMHGDNPSPVAITSYKAYSATTSFTLGQVTDTGGKVYVCTQAGTTGSTAPTTTSGYRFNDDVVDGSVKWRFLCRTDATHITMDSNAYSLRVRKSFGLNGAVTFRMTDTVNAASYASEPKWVYLGLESDHAYSTGIALLAGQGVYFCDNTWVGSTMKGNGILATGSFRGEMTAPESLRCLGNAQHGLLVNSGSVYDIKGMFSGNSQQSTGTYHGITFSASVTNFKVDATAGKSIDAGSTQGYGVFLSTGCDKYIVRGNFGGNVTGAISGHTPSSTKIVGDIIS